VLVFGLLYQSSLSIYFTKASLHLGGSRKEEEEEEGGGRRRVR